MNLYGEDAGTFSEPVYLIRYVASDDHSYRLTSLIGWGDTPAEFTVFVDGEIQGGCRNSASTRTVQVWWDQPIVLSPGGILDVMAVHYSQGLHTLRCNLMGTQV